MSRVCSSVGGSVGVAHPFHPSLHLGGILVRFCGGSCWRSLAMSWACLPPFLCVGIVCRSRSHCRPSRYPSFARGCSCGWGVSLCVGFLRSPWGSRWLHLYRLTPNLVSLHGLVASHLGLRSVFPAFTCETFHKYWWRLFIQFHWFIRVPA